jgi:hypothetical protein
MTKAELKRYLVEEAGYEDYEVNGMSPAELVDAYLAWNGIRHFTDGVFNVVKAAYEIN